MILRATKNFNKTDICLDKRVNMSNILVTGGAGFIGSHTVVELINAGHKPVIIDNLSNSDPKIVENLMKITGQRIPFYKQDYQDIPNLRTVIDNEQITGVIHFAAYKAVDESIKQPLRYYANNVSGLVSILELVEEMNVSNFVFSSSCVVYGEPGVLPVTEDTPMQTPTSPYSASKQFDERIISDTTAASTNIKSISLRYFNPIGAHKSGLIGELPLGIPANLVPYITQTAAGIRKKITVNGNDYPTADGTCIRDYIHVQDLAKAHVKALSRLEKQSARYYDVFNVGTGKGNSVLEAIKTFEEVNGVRVPHEIGPRRAGDIQESYASVEKAQNILGWKAEKTMADGLADAWKWQQSLQT